MERSILVYQGLISLTALFLIASAEIASYDDNKVYKIKQKSGCPTISCPWNCERYLDRNGCIYCGKCNKKSTCPKVDCPDLPNVGCTAVIGTDGCTTCTCHESAPRDCPSLPLCSQDCYLVQTATRCPFCKCNLPVHCRLGEEKDDPCRPGCQRQREADGCYRCRCLTDVDVCPKVSCQKGCINMIDQETGCVYDCNCVETIN